jgi:hypothetical protein
MLLFIVVALSLYILYTKPSIVPGRRRPGAEHPVIATAIPGNPIAPEMSESPAGVVRSPAARGTMTAERPKAGDRQNAVSEGGHWWRRRKRR